MASGRLVIKKISISEKVADLPIDGQLLYERMIIHTDDFGLIQGHPRTVKALTVPMIDELTTIRVKELLDEMLRLKLIAKVSYLEHKFYYIQNHAEIQPTRRDINPSTVLPIKFSNITSDNWRICQLAVNEALSCEIETERPITDTHDPRYVNDTETSRIRHVDDPKPNINININNNNTGSKKPEKTIKTANKPIASTMPVIKTKQSPDRNTPPTKPQSMKTLREVLHSRGIVKAKEGEQPKKNGIHTGWQDKAFRYAEKLEIKLTPKIAGRWLKVFKQADGGRKASNLEKAYSYLSDHPQALAIDEKLRLFFHIYENGLQSKPVG